jgi:hypothetical protein
MLTNVAVQFLEGHEADECDCPACLPACERTGKKCFIVCERCQTKIEADDVGPLKSVTKRAHYTSNRSKRRVLGEDPELREFMHLLKMVEDHA